MVLLDGPWGRVDEPTDEMWLFGCFRDFVLLLIAISRFWQIFLRTYFEIRENMLEKTKGFSRQIVVEFLQLIGKQWLLPLLLTLAWNLIPDSALQSNLSRITYLAFLLKLNVEIYTGDSADEPMPQAKVRKETYSKSNQELALMRVLVLPTGFCRISSQKLQTLPQAKKGLDLHSEGI